jgi:hypothetical protein
MWLGGSQSISAFKVIVRQTFFPLHLIITISKKNAVALQEGVDKSSVLWFYQSYRRKPRADRRAWIGPALVVSHRDPNKASGALSNGIHFDSQDHIPRGFENVVVHHGTNKSLGIRARKYQLLSSAASPAESEGASAEAASHSSDRTEGASGCSTDVDLEFLESLDCFVDEPEPFSLMTPNLGMMTESEVRATMQRFLSSDPDEASRRRKISVIQDVCRQYLREAADDDERYEPDKRLRFRSLSSASDPGDESGQEEAMIMLLLECRSAVSSRFVEDDDDCSGSESECASSYGDSMSMPDSHARSDLDEWCADQHREEIAQAAQAAAAAAVAEREKR